MRYVLASFKLLCSTLAIITVSVSGLADNHHETSSKFKVTPIQSSFNLLQGKGGNILAFSGEEGLVIVDADYADLSASLSDALKPFGDLKYIINTHWHGDHTQGNQLLGHRADILAHENVHKRLSTPQEVKLFGMVSQPYPKHARPDLTYLDTMTLRINSEVIRLVHLPFGHTDGDTIVYFENANIVHMGDHFFNGFFPFVDIDAGGDILGMADNLDKAMSLMNSDTKIVPGHGPMASIADLRAFQSMLRGTFAEIKALHGEGKDLEAMQSAGLSDQWEPWTKGFLNTDIWIKIIHQNLTK